MKLTGQRFLRHQRALFEVAADTDANNHRRTGIRACVLYSRQDSLLDALNAVCRLQHEDTAHILTAGPLGRHCEREFVAFYHIIVNNRRRIIPGVLPDQRIANYGFAQESFDIALTYALLDCFGQASAFDPQILSHLCEYHCHAGILTDRNLISSRNHQVLIQLLQDLASQRGRLYLYSCPKRFFHVLGQEMIRFDTHFLNIADDLLRMYGSHILPPLTGISRICRRSHRSRSRP